MKQTKYDYSVEKIAKAVAESGSISEVLRKLDMPTNGGVRSVILKKIKETNIDISHHVGQGHQPSGTTHNKKSWKEILLNDGVNRKASQLRRAMIEYGNEYECSLCENGPEWLGKKLVLQIDHKNGIHTDNSPDNLWFLCPNCHSQTETWGIKNMVRLVQ